MIVARFWAGVASSTFSTMIGGVITDIYQEHERDAPMSIFAGSAIFGIGFGSLIAGFITRYMTWRWIFWLQAIVNGLLVALFAVCVGETRSSIVLQQKVDILNRWEHSAETDPEGKSTSLRHNAQRRPRIIWKTASPDEKHSLWSSIATSTTRPFQLLLTEPVVTAFSLWAGFSWAVLYICLSVIPLVFEDIYNFEPHEATATFAAGCFGAILATVVGAYQERIAKHYDLLPSTPEARLYCCCVEGWLLPIGVGHTYNEPTGSLKLTRTQLFIFGWSATSGVHWIVPSIAIALATMGIFFILLTIFNYLADNYGPYASSAIAAQSFCRNALGGCFPLVTRQMFTNLGYGPASSLCGGIASVLGLVPIILIFYGDKIRERSKVAKSMAS